MNMLNRSVENHSELQMTTENRSLKMNLKQESSDGFTGQGSCVPFARWVWSRQTKSWNSKIFCGEIA